MAEKRVCREYWLEKLDAFGSYLFFLRMEKFRLEEEQSLWIGTDGLTVTEPFVGTSRTGKVSGTRDDTYLTVYVMNNRTVENKMQSFGSGWN